MEVNGGVTGLLTIAGFNWTTSFTASQQQSIQLTFEILNIASIFCCIPVIITYLVFKRRFPYAIVLFFSICVLLTHFFLLFGYFFGYEQLVTNPTLCYIQGMGIHYFGSVSMAWFFLIALDVYLVVIQKINHDFAPKLHIMFHLAAWTVPLFFVLPVVITHYYETKGLWCFIQNVHGVWEFACFYVYLVSILVAVIGIWFRTIHGVFQVVRYAHFRNSDYSYLYRHVFALGLGSIGITMMTSHRIYQALHENQPDNFFLAFSHVFSLSSLGVLVFVSYGLTRSNFSMWKSCFQRQGYEPLQSR
jgi:hypothetical protein